MRAFVLCGGFGTRLRDVIGTTQKAVAEVGGRPFLHFVIEQLIKAGCQEMVFCTHYQSEQVDEAIRLMGEEVAMHCQIVRESTPLGTGGAVINAIERTDFEGDFIALNADTFVTHEAYELAIKAQSPSLIVKKVDDCDRYGAVKLDKDKLVVEMSEKGVVGPGFISTGIYRFHTNFLYEFANKTCSIEKDILPILIESNLLKANEYKDFFIDIGTPRSLASIRNIK